MVWESLQIVDEQIPCTTAVSDGDGNWIYSSKVCDDCDNHMDIKTNHAMRCKREQSHLGFADIFAFYVPVYNYWNSCFFGMRWVGVDMSWNLFFKLCSLLFMNAVMYYIKKKIAEIS